MEALLTLTELLKTALASGAVGFTLRSGLHPVIYSDKGVQSYDSQPSTSEDIEEILRQLIHSLGSGRIADSWHSVAPGFRLGRGAAGTAPEGEEGLSNNRLD